MAIPVGNVRGIVPKTVEHLASRKINAVERLLKSRIEILASASGIATLCAEAAMKEAVKLPGAAPTANATDKKNSKGQEKNK